MPSLPVQSNSSGQITRAVYRDSKYFVTELVAHDAEFPHLRYTIFPLSLR